MALISLKWLQVSFFPYVMHKMKILIYCTTYATHHRGKRYVVRVGKKP